MDCTIDGWYSTVYFNSTTDAFECSSYIDINMLLSRKVSYPLLCFLSFVSGIKKPLIERGYHIKL